VIYEETPLAGAFVIDLEKRGDDRGFFARLACAREFAEHGLTGRFVQVNDSVSAKRGTLRGLHYQLPPSAEVKLIRCIRGALRDVILDLRSRSSTFGKAFATNLTAENRKMVYVPEGFAHGFITLEDDTEAVYFVSAEYDAERERGIRWNDPAFDIPWSFDPIVVSDKDGKHPDFDPRWHLANEQER
jgi:dTDP-4-dehydrorhamnose 3,5-epimerase